MPHLSPMNWIFALLSITLIMSIMMTTSWWNNKMTIKPITDKKSSHYTKWQW